MSYRTHTCGELRPVHVDATVRLAGWLSARRDHGQIVFVHVRDAYGVTQIVVDAGELQDRLTGLQLESVLSIEGVVRLRPDGQTNPDLGTGEIEVVARDLRVLSVVKEPLPFLVEKGQDVNEELRLRHRYLDLRRPKMATMLRRRNELCQAIRQVFGEEGFLEVHTPILSNSSPEGARDFLVPSRLHPGEFFALPQAPQQWKQLLMASGVDRYFQIAPCFRDEPARADRSPGEFYQLDIEMAFVEQEDVLGAVEAMLVRVAQLCTSKRVPTPFPRMTYADAMERYGSDKPDLRFGLELHTLTELFRDSSVEFLRQAVAHSGDVRALLVPDASEHFSRKDIDALRQLVQEAGVSGLAWLAWQDGNVRGSLAGPMADEERAELETVLDAGASDIVFLVAGQRDRIDVGLSAVRIDIGDRLQLRDPDVLLFAWVVDFPMFELDPDSGEVGFSHNPFSMPQGGYDALVARDPLEVLGYQYDLVCNGVEISSGAIRNNEPHTLYKAFEIAGYEPSVVREQFGHMIEAFELGCPPHGGIAPGLERMLMLFVGEMALREVVPFPKNQKCQDLVVRAPGPVPDRELRELGIQVRPGVGVMPASSSP